MLVDYSSAENFQSVITGPGNNATLEAYQNDTVTFFKQIVSNNLMCIHRVPIHFSREGISERKVTVSYRSSISVPPKRKA